MMLLRLFCIQCGLLAVDFVVGNWMIEIGRSMDGFGFEGLWKMGDIESIFYFFPGSSTFLSSSLNEKQCHEPTLHK